MTTCLLIVLLTSGCKSSEPGRDGAPAAPDLKIERLRADQPSPDSPPPRPRVLMKTSMGEISLELDEQRAPITVKNFLSYVDTKFYDQTIFHRVIADFMIQGGGYDTSYKLKPTQPPIKNEAGNGLSNDRGTIAMARTSVIDSATSQFFINVVDNPGLNHKDDTAAGYGYAVFGKVVAGMDVVDLIKVVPTGAKAGFTKDCPLTDVIIQSATRTN